MQQYQVRVSYLTKSGGKGDTYIIVEAKDVFDASRKATDKVRADKRRSVVGHVDTKVWEKADG